MAHRLACDPASAFLETLNCSSKTQRQSQQKALEGSRAVTRSGNRRRDRQPRAPGPLAGAGHGGGSPQLAGQNYALTCAHVLCSSRPGDEITIYAIDASESFSRPVAFSRQALIPRNVSAGPINSVRFNQIPANAGLGLEMKVIASVVVGEQPSPVAQAAYPAPFSVSFFSAS